MKKLLALFFMSFMVFAQARSERQDAVPNQKRNIKSKIASALASALRITSTCAIGAGTMYGAMRIWDKYLPHDPDGLCGGMVGAFAVCVAGVIALSVNALTDCPPEELKYHVCALLAGSCLVDFKSNNADAKASPEKDGAHPGNQDPSVPSPVSQGGSVDSYMPQE